MKILIGIIWAGCAINVVWGALTHDWSQVSTWLMFTGIWIYLGERSRG